MLTEFVPRIVALDTSADREPIDGCALRAQTLWPRLSTARLARAGDDPRRIARLVAGRTTEAPEAILAMLTAKVARR